VVSSLYIDIGSITRGDAKLEFPAEIPASKLKAKQVVAFHNSRPRIKPWSYQSHKCEDRNSGNRLTIFFNH